MLLDPAIRDWVMLPLILLVVLVTYSRMYAMRLISPAADGSGVDAEGIKQRGLVARAQRVRANGGYISYGGFVSRRNWLVAPEHGKLLDVSVKDKNPMAAGPMAQMDMMKMQMVNMASQMGIGVLVGTFFTGFVALKLPFALTERFKGLTQQGIGVPGLDTSYVSTSSWYYMVQFGMGNVFRLFNRTGGGSGGAPSAIDEARMMQMQMGGAMPGMGGAGAPPFLAKTAFGAEAKAFSTVEWAPVPLLRAERALLLEAAALGLGALPASVQAIVGGGGAVIAASGKGKTE